MTTDITREPVRAGSDWLALREPADAAARATDLVDRLRPHLPTDALEVQDLGSGTGSMARWLAPLLPGPQRWVLVDRDAELLDLADDTSPPAAADGAPVRLETRRGDLIRLDPAELAGSSLVTASALLDMLTAEEVDRLVAGCAAAACPVLVTLSVVGRVELEPSDPLDGEVEAAFNAHQRRTTPAGALLGPDAFEAAVAGLRARGLEVVTAPSPWRLGADHRALAAEWFNGWLDAACEQRPDLALVTASYGRRRLAEAADGRLSVTVHHRDLLALPG
jgi:hypothetical protein